MLRALCTLAMTAVFAIPAFAAEEKKVLIDDFEGGMSNKLGGNGSTYVQEPSRALALVMKDKKLAHDGEGILMLKYDKKAKGGPYDSGGWCGYYTMVGPNKRFFDATAYKTLTFWVKGATGEENFVVGIADQHWNEVGDSVKSEAIGKYLSTRHLAKEWQKAKIPLDTFLVDMKKLVSIAVCFEGSVLPGGEGKGTVYIDGLTFEEE
ncbi:MAG: hypothetical protein HY211_00520 [Candidatus Omnitrophica bacterium]|nr:hypothetical protein [Candidatus Omnitrophota bacterium]